MKVGEKSRRKEKVYFGKVWERLGCSLLDTLFYSDSAETVIESK